MITQARLKKLLYYHPESGDFVWLQNRRFKGVVGMQAGSLLNDQYILLCVDGHRIPAHRAAWFYMMGVWPPETVDHRDRNGLDNRWSNLRLASYAQNGRNRIASRTNTSGHKNITFDAKYNLYRVQITRNYKQHYFGGFKDIEEAVAVRDAGLKQLHKSFARAA